MTILYIHIFYMPHISAALSHFPGHRVRGPGDFQQVFARDSIYDGTVTYTENFLGPARLSVPSVDETRSDILI